MEELFLVYVIVNEFMVKIYFNIFYIFVEFINLENKIISKMVRYKRKILVFIKSIYIIYIFIYDCIFLFFFCLVGI